MDDAAVGSPVARSARRLPGWLMPLLRVVATVALMAMVLSKIRWDTLLATMRNCDWRWWFAGLAVSVLVQCIAAIRWAALARPIGFPFPVGTFVWRFFEGLFFNLCLPSSIGGDLVKAYRLADSTAGRLLAGCTVLADRLTGLAALAVLACTALLAKRWGLGVPAMLAVGTGLLGAALGAFWLGVGSIDRILSAIPERHAARQFIAQLLPYQQQPALMTRAVGWSLLIQMGGSVAVALVARALGVSLPLDTWFAVVPLVTLAMVLPISMLGLGIREQGLEFLLEPHGVAPERAVAIGLLWLACSILTGLVGGLLFLLDRRPLTMQAATGQPPHPA
ncbi:MAG: lysylphosphatidylglycerol synthase transmembrane domain-containing protein [Planctomycetia bacterium]